MAQEANMLVATQTEDRHGVWSPWLFRVELERALTSALQRSRASQTRSERRARRPALRGSALTTTVELHRLEPSPSIQLDGWYSEAPKATGEGPDVHADEEDADLRLAANLARRFDAKTVWNVTGLEPDEYDAVPMRTADAIARDKDDLSWLHRDEAAAPKGYGMTDAELRRAWVQNARLRYRDALTEALRKHRGRLTCTEANNLPALRAEAQKVKAVQARWSFVDELARHGVHAPEKELVAKLKVAVAPTYEQALTRLTERRRLAESGQLDRYRRELAVSVPA
jgi:hypothetical protein